MTRRRLPIGIQTFRKLREQDCYYVDKMVKDSDAHVRFTFLTGICKFSRVNLVSQLNNLTDLTPDPVYSSLDQTVSTEALLFQTG